MEQALELKTSQVRRILAEYYNVPLSKVIARRYGFVVLREVDYREQFLPRREDEE